MERPSWLERVLEGSPGLRSRVEPLYVPVTADGEVHPVVVEWARGHHSANTAASYASDVALFFRWLGPGRDWLTADRGDLNAFMERRRFGDDPSGGNFGSAASGVSPSTLNRNLVSIRALFDVAVGMGFISGNPVPSGRLNATSGRLCSDANWLTRRAYERWRSEGLLGMGAARAETLAMRDRNAAFADLLYHTGMRRTEGAGLLTFEVPNSEFSSRLVRGRVPAGLSKGRPQRGRVMYLDRPTRESIEAYVTGAREVEVRFGQASGLYESDKAGLIVKGMSRAGGVPDKVLIESAGLNGWVRLDSLTMAQRRHLYALDADGQRRPLVTWLAHGGAPLAAASWNQVFKDASARTVGFRPASGLVPAALDDTSIQVHPHMLRHSFALYVFALAAQIEMHRRGTMTPGAFDSMVRQQNIWLRVQNLLGHRSMETTRSFYLAPVLALEWDWFLRAASDAPLALDDTLSEVAEMDDRVVDA